LRAFLKEGPDDELAQCVGGFQRAAWDYDLLDIMKHYERLEEIILEQYNKELKDWFRRSKVVKGFAYAGIGLTCATIASLSIPAGLPTLLSILLNVKKVQREVDAFSRWLVERWPFAEKGLPFFLWKYDIKPESQAQGSTSSNEAR
jgi:hypothetical protein